MRLEPRCPRAGTASTRIRAPIGRFMLPSAFQERMLLYPIIQCTSGNLETLRRCRAVEVVVDEGRDEGLSFAILLERADALALGRRIA